MQDSDQTAELWRLQEYLRELEEAHRRLATENAQLRASHSYRLGQAFVQVAKRRRFGALSAFVREVRGALRPQTATEAELPKRPVLSELFAVEGNTQDALSSITDKPPPGTEIARRSRARPVRVTGILGNSLVSRLGDDIVANAALRYDRYDDDWEAAQATHLVIDADQLSNLLGWEHVFSLRDPAATVEMASMLHKARQAGMRTVLIRPSEPHRLPLLSRTLPLFDTVLSLDEITRETFIN